MRERHFIELVPYDSKNNKGVSCVDIDAIIYYRPQEMGNYNTKITLTSGQHVISNEPSEQFENRLHDAIKHTIHK